MIKDILIIFVFLLILTFATHFIRTFAFNRHEAVTFECSVITVVIAFANLVIYGINWFRVGEFLLFLALFIANAYSQYHFYLKLQSNISKVFKRKADTLMHATEDKVKEKDRYINDNLKILAAVAIMPSFSRFIEESKFFNSPENIIGLTKSIMQRSRFQKKKYLMREKFSECINYIGPCRATITDYNDSESSILSDPIHPNDLALSDKDEKLGLFLFDFTGFGAMLFLFIQMILDRVNPGVLPASADYALPIPMFIIGLFPLIFLAHFLRNIAFARYESIPFEALFVTLILEGYLFYQSFEEGILKGKYPWNIISIVLLVIFFALFTAAALENKKYDKKLHIRINKCFVPVISSIEYENETTRVQRKFLENLQYISTWAITPQIHLKQVSTNTSDDEEDSNKKKNIFDLMKEKRRTPQLMAELFEMIKPNYADILRKENADFDKDNNLSNHFRLFEKEAKSAWIKTMVLGVIGLVLLITAIILKSYFSLPII